MHFVQASRRSEKCSCVCSDWLRSPTLLLRQCRAYLSIPAAKRLQALQIVEAMAARTDSFGL